MSERIHKQIIVSVEFRGRRVWMLADAVKVGKHYKVSKSNIQHLLDKANAGRCSQRGSTFTIG